MGPERQSSAFVARECVEGVKKYVPFLSPHGLNNFSEGVQRDDVTAQRAEREINRKR
jgi:hypothetical protein